MHNLNFERFVKYDTRKVGITLDVEIRLGDASAEIEAKIDTGAEACIFERIYGEQLGLEIEKGERQNFSTVTDSFLTFGHWVTLIAGETELDTYVFFAADESFRKNVLGRNGWLNRVIIGINDYDGKLYLSRYESND